MAEKKAKKRQIKQVETVRQRTEKTTAQKPAKKRKLRSAAVKGARPLRFLRVIVPPYFRNSWKELKQVSWPSRKQTRQLTFAVFMFAIGFAAFITILDYILDKLFKQVLLK